MENNHLQKEITYDFLYTPEAKVVFADVDNALKEGRHIQKWEEKMHSFLTTHFNSLKRYYDDLFHIRLNREGEGDREYFFIDFYKDKNGYYQRGGIAENREYLAEGHLIIAFLIIRIYVLEPIIERWITTERFKKDVLLEYEEYKPYLLKLFAGSEGTEETDLELLNIENELDKALRKFNDLGWIRWENKNKDAFEVQSSINRLLNLYENHILSTPL